MHVRSTMHEADVDAQVTLARAVVADRKRRYGLTANPSERANPYRNSGFHNQRLHEDEMIFDRRRKSGEPTPGGDKRHGSARGHEGWVTSGPRQSRVFHSKRTEAGKQPLRKTDATRVPQSVSTGEGRTPSEGAHGSEGVSVEGVVRGGL